ncbi:Putative Rhodanese-like domain, pyridoxal-phosphate dependent enzyme [Septoria linicola]|uniref:Rhodanese-like domain, pyridoxal-phosphate dependent enzyme n=1 Tax=Septoria linicola TaxID=215465 RepID=A0A9Q9B1H0_9PEZI|nr:Putative Rhodanese-like domain, pyridoxal-phosphate dependent enzyme [Septoria linicola]
MATDNIKNVYSGPDSLKKYFDPDCAPPLPLVELPAHLNPYYDDGVRIYAKMMSCHPANNVKCMPAMNLLSKEVDADKTKTIVEYSSGSTVISMSMVARVFHNITDTHAYLSNKTSEAKLRLMQFFGLKLTLFGGPSQPEPTDERGGIQSARLQSQQSDAIINPNQYENDGNWKSHVRWTGPQILKQLPEITLICAGMGTSGTMTGLGTYFKEAKPSVFRLGVVTAAGDRVPGPRSYALLAPVEFPWKEAIDHVEHVGSFESFSLSLNLCRNGLLCGPSSGFNLQGLFNLLEKRKVDGTISELRAEDGLVHSVFLCCDLPYQYMQEYFDKLGPQSFPPITNEHLTKVDLFRYDEAWELSPASALPLAPETLVIDLRRQADFREFHFPAALSIPLASLKADSPSPFFAPELLDQQWTELESLFSESYLQSQFRDRKILCLCYDGDTSRIATSVLRAKGFQAESVKGGQIALAQTEAFKSMYLPKTKGHGLFAEDKKADSVFDEKSERATSDSEFSDKKGDALSDSELD